MDQSPLLDNKGHREYQILLGMLQWNCSIKRPELGPPVSSLNCFGSYPCEYHLELRKQDFCYQKYSAENSQNIAIDSNPVNYERHKPN